MSIALGSALDSSTLIGISVRGEESAQLARAMAYEWAGISRGSLCSWEEQITIYCEALIPSSRSKMTAPGSSSMAGEDLV